MGLSAEFCLLHSELNDFLFAQMGEEGSGAPLSVLSALTRLGADPWAEGARLSDLPRDAAVQALVSMITMFPRQTRGASDAPMLAERLVELLPRSRERVWDNPAANGKVSVRSARRDRLGDWRSGVARIARGLLRPARLSTPAWFALGVSAASLLFWLIV